MIFNFFVCCLYTNIFGSTGQNLIEVFLLYDLKNCGMQDVELLEIIKHIRIKKEIIKKTDFKQRTTTKI